MAKRKRKNGDTPQPTPEPVMRLRFEWSGGACRLIKRVMIPEKVLPAAEAKIDPKAHPRGFFVEGADAKGRTIYRRSMVSPFRRVAEVFDPDGRIHAVDHVPPAVQFDVLVPDRPEITSVRVVSNPHPFHANPGAKESATAEIVSVAMREKRLPDKKDRHHGQD